MPFEMEHLIDRLMLPLYGDVRIFVPAFISAEEEDSVMLNLLDINYVLKTIYAIEFIAIAISVPIAMMHSYCLSRSTFFHPNLARIAQAFLCGYYSAVASRIIIFLYQSNIICYDENTPTSRYTLIMASIIRSWFFTKTLAALSEALAERQFAFFFVADYEKNQRLWISAGIVITSRLLTLFSTYMIMIRMIPGNCVIGGSSITLAIFLLVFTLMYRRNHSRLLELRSGVISARTINTLSVKFQLIENLRVMKLVMIAFCVASILIALGLALMFLTFFVYENEIRKGQVCFALLDLLVAVSSAGCFFAFLIRISEWRRVLCESALARMFYSKSGHRICSSWRMERLDNHQGASNQYFDQLKQAWQ